MTDLFKEKAEDWDTRPIPAQISEGVANALKERVPLTQNLEVLDFGAGTGLVCGKLAPKVGRIIAVDISEAMLAKLKAKEELKDKVETRCQDITQNPLEEKVDLVVSAMALHHVKDTGGLLKTFARHLRPGGRIALADLDAEDGSFHPPGTEGIFHHGFVRSDLMKKAEDAGFTEVEMTTALEVHRDDRRYPVFLLTARAKAELGVSHEEEQQKIVADLKRRISERDAQRQERLEKAKAALGGQNKEPFHAESFKSLYRALNPEEKEEYIPWETLLKEAEYDYYVSYPDKLTLRALIKHMQYLDGFS
jgi:SAM-dependent methyltransferase